MASLSSTSINNTGNTGATSTVLSVANGALIQFGSDDVDTSNTILVTEGLFAGNGIMTAAYKSAAQWAASSSNYYLYVYNNAGLSSSFYDVSYGNVNGHIPNGATSTNYAYKYDPAKAIYTQNANMVLPVGTVRFSVNGKDTPRAAFVSFKNSYLKDRMDLGSWTLALSGSAGPKKIRLTDNSSLTSPLKPTSNDPDAYYVVSGAAGSVYGNGSPVYYGAVYPNYGLIMLDCDKFTGSAGGGIGLTISASNSLPRVANRNFFNAIASGSYFQARNARTMTAVQCYCRIGHKNCNFSNNPTWVTGSANILRYADMYQNPKVYLTTVGLYDANGVLLAMARLNKPIQKSFDNEALIRVTITT